MRYSSNAFTNRLDQTGLSCSWEFKYTLCHMKNRFKSIKPCFKSYIAQYSSMTKKRVFNKKTWQIAVGTERKPRRLSLQPNQDSLYFCPVETCDTEGY